MSRPPEHYVHAAGQVVVVPARVAAWLGRHGLDQLRVQARGVDAEVDAVLAALRLAALSWLPSAVAEAPPEVAGRCAEATSELTLMSTRQAADRLGLTDRAVRLACAAGRLPAEQVDGRWRITREDLEHYRTGRTAA